MPSLAGKPILRFALFVGILATGFLTLQLPAVRERLVLETLAADLQSLGHHPAAPPLFVAATAALTAVGLPGTVPLVVGGGVFGAVFGGLLAWAGLVGGAAISFALTHTLARDLVLQLMGERLGKIERQLQRLSFWAMLRLRFVPVPYAVANYSVCLAGVRLGVYLSSTAAALLPISLVYAYFASSLIGAAEGDRAVLFRDLGLAILFLFLLSFVPPRVIAWLQRRSKSGAPVPPPPPEGRP